MEIQIAAENLSSTKLRGLLESTLQPLNTNLTMEIKKSKVKVRGIDPAILVAIVGTLGTALGALITGLLQVAQQTAAKKIVLQSQSGQRLEVPAGISPEELDNLIEKLKVLDDNIVKILLP